MGSAWVTIGWVGFGASGGLFPEVRLGLLAIGCTRGAISDHIHLARRTLSRAVDILRTAERRP